jgi:macrolide transport system ATP-binding/permease protein
MGLSLWRRLVARLRRTRIEDDFAEEIRLHIDQRRQSLIDGGMDPRQADREARRLFGNQTVIRERAREYWTIPTLSSLVQDVRFALRLMRRSPGYAAAVIVTVALGTGLNGAVFVIFNAALLRAPEVPRVDEVVRMDEGRPMVGPSYPDYVDYRDRVAGALDLAAYSGIGIDVRIPRSNEVVTDRLTAVLASGNYFAVLNVPTLHGRTFDGRDDLPPLGTPVVVLSEPYWAKRFDRDPSVIGRSIELNHQPFTIIGIVPASFRGVEIAGGGAPSVRPMYVPLWCRPLLEPGIGVLRERTTWWGLQAVGRLRPGVTIGEARARVAVVAAALDREYAGQRDARTPWVAPIAGFDPRMLRGEAAIVAAAMGTATLLVLLVACANVANLGLARGVARSRETAIRLSLGAGRWRILRQFLTESFLLAACGTGLGFALAIIALRAATATADGQPFVLSLTPDARVTFYALVVAVLVCAVTGLVPALQASKPGVLSALKDGHGYRRSRLRAVFVGAEVAICLTLLVVTGLMLRSAQRARDINPIIPVENLLSIDASDSAQLGYQAKDRAALLAEIERRVRELPGVVGTAQAQPVPFSGNRHGTIVRRVDAADGPSPRVHLSSVSPSFFALANLPIVRGRTFESTAGPEVVVNETLAEQLWGTADPIGQRFTAGGDYSRTDHIVVGVVRDSPFVSLLLRDEPFMFRPLDPSGGGAVVARTAGPASVVARAAKAAGERVDPRLSIVVELMADGIEGEIGAARAGAGVAGGVGGVALLLALFGVGAVTANAVAQRTREIGIRMALGAQTSDATSLVVRQSMRPVLGGLALGLLAAALVGRAMTSILYGLSGIDPVAFVSAAAFLVAASLVAAWLPARRAARVDPLIALRAE